MGMNKKQKKQLDVLRKKQQKLMQLVAAAKEQPDDPSDLNRLKDEMAEVEAEVEKLKNA